MNGWVDVKSHFKDWLQQSKIKLKYLKCNTSTVPPNFLMILMSFRLTLVSVAGLAKILITASTAMGDSSEFEFCDTTLEFRDVLADCMETNGTYYT